LKRLENSFAIFGSYETKRNSQKEQGVKTGKGIFLMEITLKFFQ